VARAEQRLGTVAPGMPGVGRAAPGTRIDGTAASIAEKQRQCGQTARFDLILF